MIALGLATSVALTFAAAGGLDGPTVRVELLERSPPREVLLRSGVQTVQLAARGETLLRDGTVTVQALALGPARWRVGVLGAPDRVYTGAIEARAYGGAVRLALLAPLEWYVARVVASETSPGTPPEALRAQAIVVRSFALASHRHPGGALCDLAHCQLLRGHGIAPTHLAAADAAARATAGLVLRLASGNVAEAVFHGACGGHTADPHEAFGGDTTGAAAVADPGCSGPDWSATLSSELLMEVARASFAATGAAAGGRAGFQTPFEFELIRGAGGWVTQVVALDDVARVSGDAFARALDRALRWNQVRSSRFRIERLPSNDFRIVGSGLGHGVGLCQAGAARRAADGESYTAILGHYFPNAIVGR